MDRKRKVALVAGITALATATGYWLTNTWSGTMVFSDGSKGDFWAPWWVQVVECAAAGIPAGCAASILAFAFIRKTPNLSAAPDR